MTDKRKVVYGAKVLRSNLDAYAADRLMRGRHG